MAVPGAPERDPYEEALVELGRALEVLRRLLAVDVDNRHYARRHAGPWSREEVIDRINAWHELFGEPPSGSDWNRGMRRAHAAAALDHFESLALRYLTATYDAFPQPDAVRRLFGSWRRAIAAAGHRQRPVGRRGRSMPSGPGP